MERISSENPPGSDAAVHSCRWHCSARRTGGDDGRLRTGQYDPTRIVPFSSAERGQVLFHTRQERVVSGKGIKRQLAQALQDLPRGKQWPPGESMESVRGAYSAGGRAAE